MKDHHVAFNLEHNLDIAVTDYMNDRGITFGDTFIYCGRTFRQTDTFRNGGGMIKVWKEVDHEPRTKTRGDVEALQTAFHHVSEDIKSINNKLPVLQARLSAHHDRLQALEENPGGKAYGPSVVESLRGLLICRHGVSLEGTCPLCPAFAREIQP